MCVILSCAANKRPTDELLASCWASNPDGAGFMYPDHGLVHGRKGLMTLQDLTDALASVPDDVPLCIHFRIGTSGGHDERVTHPYPVTAYLDDLHSTEWVARYGIAHNGVLRGMWTDDEGGISDTVAYVMDVAAGLLDACDDEGLPYLNEVTETALTQSSAGSRLMLMDGDGGVMLTGFGWNECADGIDASNQSWRNYSYTPASWPRAWKAAR